MSRIRPAAAAEDLELREGIEQGLLGDGELLGVSVVELLGGVQLGMAQLRRIDP